MSGLSVQVKVGPVTCTVRMPVTSKAVKACPHCGCPTTMAPDGVTPLEAIPKNYKVREKDKALMAPTHLDRCQGRRRIGRNQHGRRDLR